MWVDGISEHLFLQLGDFVTALVLCQQKWWNPGPGILWDIVGMILRGYSLIVIEIEKGNTWFIIMISSCSCYRWCSNQPYNWWYDIQPPSINTHNGKGLGSLWDFCGQVDMNLFCRLLRDTVSWMLWKKTRPWDAFVVEGFGDRGPYMAVKRFIT